MQLGFVIDHSRCIGCHACTVACKAENDVPVGSFRTWVKYTEKGTFPSVRRSFAVLRCNQCTDAPCVEICPVKALDKRGDGIVDVDPKACIGCKACMQGCPYDALHINEEKGTAEKCHFCAHRVEQGLAPACAVVCPTEAIIPGDFHDPKSAVSQLRDAHALTARKREAGTGPNVLYREAAEAGLDPMATDASGGHLWADKLPGLKVDPRLFEEMETKASARTVYDAPRNALWGWKISAYLFLKSLAAGAFLVGATLLSPLRPASFVSTAAAFAVPLLALSFLTLTMAVLVADLKRPERFLYILTRPNWNSWLARGSFILGAYGLLLALWLLAALLGHRPAGVLGGLFLGLTGLAAALSASYTGWLFRQAKGRPLWMRRGLPVHFLVQAVLAGAALLILCAPLVGADFGDADVLRRMLRGALVLHLVLVLTEGRLPAARREEEHHRAHKLISHGPYALRHWLFGLGLGIAVPLLLTFLPDASLAWSVAGALALVGLAVEEDLLVRAGQALPIS